MIRCCWHGEGSNHHGQVHFPVTVKIGGDHCLRIGADWKRGFRDECTIPITHEDGHAGASKLVEAVCNSEVEIAVIVEIGDSDGIWAIEPRNGAAAGPRKVPIAGAPLARNSVI